MTLIKWMTPMKEGHLNQLSHNKPSRTGTCTCFLREVCLFSSALMSEPSCECFCTIVPSVRCVTLRCSLLLLLNKLHTSCSYLSFLSCLRIIVYCIVQKTL